MPPARNAVNCDARKSDSGNQTIAGAKMTMPHLMNCAHSESGWCISCVSKECVRAEAWKAAAEALYTASITCGDRYQINAAFEKAMPIIKAARKLEDEQ